MLLVYHANPGHQNRMQFGYLLAFLDLRYVCVYLPMVRETGVQSKVESYQTLKKW